jgi:hypothetical protein
MGPFRVPKEGATARLSRVERVEDIRLIVPAKIAPCLSQ